MKNLLFLLLLTAATGCATAPEKTPTANTETESVATAPQNLCFRKEYPYKDNSSMKDVVELQLSIDGSQVTGTYNWLPAEKDQRKGTLTGTIVDKTITANYRFMQEGIESTVPLQITLTEKEAMVSGENAELGMDATLAKVGCK